MASSTERWMTSYTCIVDETEARSPDHMCGRQIGAARVGLVPDQTARAKLRPGGTIEN
jgi:hypothetical protein